MNLRDWQKRGWEYFKDHPNCIFEVATGAGKTFMTIYIIKKILEQEPNLKVLIIGPKNVIIEHTWVDELRDHGFPINKVGIYNGTVKEFSQITVVSMASLYRLIETGIYDAFDMVVFDEVHNYGTKTFEAKIKGDKKYKLGLTATLQREDMRHIYLKKYFKNNIFKYDIEEALNDEVLNPFDFYHIKIPMDPETKIIYDDLSDKIKFLYSNMKGIVIKTLNPENKEHSILLKLINDRKELINNYPLKKDAVKNIINDNKSSKILVFNQYNKISTMLYWELQDTNVSCDIMNSTIPMKTREKIFRDFEQDKLNILLTTTMLDEGYNLPKIDIAILMAQNSTDKQFIQRMGRVLRKKDKNSKVYYLTVEDTYEEENFNKKKDFIKHIANTYNEVNR